MPTSYASRRPKAQTKPSPGEAATLTLNIIMVLRVIILACRCKRQGVWSCVPQTAVICRGCCEGFYLTSAIIQSAKGFSGTALPIRWAHAQPDPTFSVFRVWQFREFGFLFDSIVSDSLCLSLAHACFRLKVEAPNITSIYASERT